MILSKKTIPSNPGLGLGRLASEFDALTYDIANTAEIWDGDTYTFLDAVWAGIVNSNSFAVTVGSLVGALNTHNTLIFNGVNQEASGMLPSVATPLTIYIVLRQITYTAGDFLICDGIQDITRNLLQFGVSPNIRLDNDGDDLDTTQLVLNTFNIVTLMNDGGTDIIRIGLNTEQSGSSGDSPVNGFTLANRQGGAVFGNCEFAFIIVRSVQDSTAVQNAYINWLKTRFAI